jgi:hypothetical protein
VILIPTNMDQPEVVSAAGGSFVGVHAASSTIGTAAIARRGRDMARLQ